MKIKKICIVGYGSHVENTIIPSLNIHTKNIKIITKKQIDDFETFSNIRSALKKLTKDYIFFNSTPPKFHYSISRLILSSGFNVIVEKPLCLKVNQLEKLYNIAKKKNLFVFENMMYFYSKQFQILKNLLKKRSDIKKIDMKFSIPDFARNSFRIEKSLDSSILYDMGCYPFSLISYFGFDSNNYKVLYKTKKKKINFLEILFTSKKIKFKITLTIYKAYKNYVKVTFKDKAIYYFHHFFYGKKIKKTNYLHQPNKKIIIQKINEENLFKNIFNYSNQKLFKLSRKQFSVIRNYLIILNSIKKKLNYSSY